MLSPFSLVPDSLETSSSVSKSDIHLHLTLNLCFFNGCNLSEFTLFSILGQEEAWSLKINREVQEK